MTRTFLIATVAALAITSPAQGQRGDRDQKEERAQKSEKAKAQRDGGQRAERSQQRAQRDGGQRAERRQARAQERAQERPRREQRMQARERASEPRREFRQQRAERRERRVESRERARPQVERRTRMLERRANVSAQRAQRAERRDTRRIERQERQATQRNVRQLQRQERQATQQNFRQFQRQERRADRQANFERRADAVQPRETQRQRTWEGFSSRIARRDDDRRDRRDKVRVATIGQRVSPDWFADYAPVRFQSFYQPTRDYYYRYDDDNGYRYQINRDNGFVSALFPILGGAYSVGRPMPYYYDSYYNVPYGYSSLYYDTPNSYYRYGDGAIYQIDPTTQLISGIVALLTGQSFGIGQTLPMGYDTYNVPYAYRSQYYDTDDRWYRYDDGYIYGVDPRTRMIQTSYPVYGGYDVGSPWPSYAGYDNYDYAVPDYYGDLYYAEPGYDYRYASNGIYQVDPQNQLIAALVALVTGQNFGVGQRLPMGYDAYNLPLDYRDRYYDDDQSLYRYADGRIYQVDPGTRLIERVIIV